MATKSCARRGAAKLRACPQCGYDAIWVDRTFVVEFTGKQVFGGKRVPAHCITATCNQRYWYYPESGRITLRNVGPYSRYYHPPVIATVGEAGPEEPHLPEPKDIFVPARRGKKLSYRLRRLIHRTARAISILGYRAQGAKV